LTTILSSLTRTEESLTSVSLTSKFSEGLLHTTTCLLHAGWTCKFGVLFLYFVSPRGTGRGFKIPARNKHKTLAATVKCRQIY